MREQATPRFALVVVALAIVYVVWGSTYLAIRVVVQDAPPLTSMGLRFVAAGTILAGFLVLRRGGLRHLRVDRRQALGAALLALCLPVLGNGLVSVGENLGARSGLTALLIAVAPLMIVVFRAVDRDRPRPATSFGVLLGFCGLAVLLLLGRSDGGEVRVLPALVVLFAATCWAFGSYIQGRLWLPADPFVTSVYEMLFGGVFLVVAGPLAGERFSFDYPVKTWAALGYLVVIGSVVAFTAYVWLVSNAPISLVATYAYVNPVIAVFLGWLILSEPVTWPIVLGGAIVIAAVAVVITSERRAAEPALVDADEPDDEPAAAA